MPEIPVYTFVSWYVSPSSISWMKRLATPVRSDTKASAVPSGDHCGLMFDPSMPGSTSMTPVSRWNSAMALGPVRRLSRSACGPRSVTNAMDRPSGDHAGCKAAYRSFVSCRRLVPSMSTTNRSERPPAKPVNTSWLPYGAQAGLVIPATGMLMRRWIRLYTVSKMMRSSRPPFLAGNARNRPSGDQAPAEFKNRKLSISALKALRTRRRSMRPDATSAR